MAWRLLAVAILCTLLHLTSGACGDVEGCEPETSLALVMLQRDSSVAANSKMAVSRTGRYEACQDTVPVMGSKRPMPSRGYIVGCCNPLMVESPLLFTTLVKFLQVGGRYVDTAPDYGHNHRGEYVTGRAIRASGVPREDIWLQTKVDNDGWHPRNGSAREWTLAQVKASLSRLGVAYVDSMVLHFGPKQAARQGFGFSPEEHTEMWLGLLDAKRVGLVLSIGVCEHTRAEIEHLIKSSGEKPVIAVTFFNPWVPLEQLEFVNWLKSIDIAVSAYSPVLFQMWEGDDPQGSRLELARQHASKYNATYGQLSLQIVLDQGLSFITPLYHPEYLPEDLPCFGFQTTARDIELLRVGAAPARCDGWVEKYGQDVGFECKH